MKKIGKIVIVAAVFLVVLVILQGHSLTGYMMKHTKQAEEPVIETPMADNTEQKKQETVKEKEGELVYCQKYDCYALEEYLLSMDETGTDYNYDSDGNPTQKSEYRIKQVRQTNSLEKEEKVFQNSESLQASEMDMGDGTMMPATEWTYLFFTVDITNASESAQKIRINNCKIYGVDIEGQVYEIGNEMQTCNVKEIEESKAQDRYSVSFKAGEKKEFTLAYMVPKEVMEKGIINRILFALTIDTIEDTINKEEVQYIAVPVDKIEKEN